MGAHGRPIEVHGTPREVLSWEPMGDPFATNANHGTFMGARRRANGHPWSITVSLWEPMKAYGSQSEPMGNLWKCMGAHGRPMCNPWGRQDTHGSPLATQEHLWPITVNPWESMKADGTPICDPWAILVNPWNSKGAHGRPMEVDGSPICEPWGTHESPCATHGHLSSINVNQ